MDPGMIFLVFFFASIAAFLYLAYMLHKGSAERWTWVGLAVWVMLGFLIFLAGFLSGNIVTMVIGLAMVFANSSLFLTHYVGSKFKAERLLEVIFGIMSLGIIVYGYIVTGSIILGVLTLLIAAMITVAIMLSHVLPRIHARIKH